MARGVHAVRANISIRARVIHPQPGAPEGRHSRIRYTPPHARGGMRAHGSVLFRLSHQHLSPNSPFVSRLRARAGCFRHMPTCRVPRADLHPSDFQGLPSLPFPKRALRRSGRLHDTSREVCTHRRDLTVDFTQTTHQHAPPRIPTLVLVAAHRAATYEHAMASARETADIGRRLFSRLCGALARASEVHVVAAARGVVVYPQASGPIQSPGTPR